MSLPKETQQACKMLLESEMAKKIFFPELCWLDTEWLSNTYTLHVRSCIFFMSGFPVWFSVLLFQMCQWAGAQRTGGAVTTYVRRWLASPSAHAIRASDCMESARVWVSKMLKSSVDTRASVANAALLLLSHIWCMWFEDGGISHQIREMRSHAKKKKKTV